MHLILETLRYSRITKSGLGFSKLRPHYIVVIFFTENLCPIAYSWVQDHYDDVIMGTIVSQITSLMSVYSTVYSGADQSKHQRSASLAFVWGIHRGPVNSPHKWPVTRKMFPFDDVIMYEVSFLKITYPCSTFVIAVLYNVQCKVILDCVTANPDCCQIGKCIILIITISSFPACMKSNNSSFPSYKC